MTTYESNISDLEIRQKYHEQRNLYKNENYESSLNKGKIKHNFIVL